MRLRHFTAAACVAGIVTLAVSAVRGEEDHLEGYKVKDPTKFKPSGSYTVDNQFGTATCELKKAKFFLVQSEKNNGNDPRGGPAGHFVCYIAKCSGNLPTSNTEVDDQFGTHTLEAKKTQLVCVPADKHVCGDGELDPGEQCDGTAGACPGCCQPDCTCNCPPCTVQGAACGSCGSGTCQPHCGVGFPEPLVCVVVGGGAYCLGDGDCGGATPNCSAGGDFPGGPGCAFGGFCRALCP